MASLGFVYKYIIILPEAFMMILVIILLYSTDPSLIVRLAGGRTLNEGRVEVLSDGAWGTVCDDNFGMTEAYVVCRQLGYSGVLYQYHGAYFGAGEASQDIVLDDLQCEGDELSICDCEHADTHNCGHQEDVSVICEPNGKSVCVHWSNYCYPSQGVSILTGDAARLAKTKPPVYGHSHFK